MLYAHIVLSTEDDLFAGETKYWIGNIQQRHNGWCYREHIYGILVRVETAWQGKWYTRPLPKGVFEKVQPMVQRDRWDKEAESLCEPDWNMPSR